MMGMLAAKKTLSWETWLERQQQQGMQRRTPVEVLLLLLLAQQAQSGRSLYAWTLQVGCMHIWWREQHCLALWHCSDKADFW
jgi:hypothetical protein